MLERAVSLVEVQMKDARTACMTVMEQTDVGHSRRSEEERDYYGDWTSAASRASGCACVPERAC